MDVILKVIEGAKSGSKVTVKKERFLIGRSPKCHLSAASTAISRQHCAIMRRDANVSVRDLGSRNGTLVNGNKIAQETPLNSGDELTVGPLKFMVMITHGINNAKRSHVKSVADAVDRAVEKGASAIQEDDISSWLLEPGDSIKSVAETTTIQFDDTNAAQLKKLAESLADDETSTGMVTDEPLEDLPPEEEQSPSDSDTLDKKKEPGKLPRVPAEPPTKDSREAALEALRSWNRRR